MENQVVGPRFQLLFDLFSAPWLAGFFSGPSDQTSYLSVSSKKIHNFPPPHELTIKSGGALIFGLPVASWSVAGWSWMQLHGRRHKVKCQSHPLSVRGCTLLNRAPFSIYPGCVLHLSGMRSLTRFLSLFFQLSTPLKSRTLQWSITNFEPPMYIVIAT